MKFDLTGYNIDNLLKTLYQKKIILYNVQKTGRKQVSFEILDKDYKKVKHHIANFKVKQTLSKIKMIPKLILANIGIIIGCLIGAGFGVYASNYTWQILIYGTEELSQTDILNVLGENGIRKGRINKETSEQIENILLNYYDRIAQVSVIREGTAIIINLSEKLVYNQTEFEPIKAKYSGVIKHINIITGTTNIKVGDYVNAGDVLVLPFNVNANGEKVSVKPMAEIKAEMFVVAKCEMKKTDQILVRTGKTEKVYNYKLKNINLFRSKSKNSFALFETNVYNENISGIIPLNRDVIIYHELEMRTIEHDFEQEEENLIQKSKDLANQNMPSGEVLNEVNKVNIIDNTMFAITTIQVFGDIV